MKISNLFKRPRKPQGKFIVGVDAQDKFYDQLTNELDSKALARFRDSISQGRLNEQDRLFRIMLDKWPRLRKNLSEIAGATSRLTWSVSPWSQRGEEPSLEDQRLADLVDDAIWRCNPESDGTHQNFEELIEAITYAIARGQTVHEISWKSEGSIIYPTAYVPIPARFYAWEYRNGEPDKLMLFPDGIEYNNCTQFTPDKFIIAMHKQGVDHPIFGANLRSLIAWFGASVYGLPWLMQYCTLFGIPFRVATADGEEAKKNAASMLRNIGSAGFAVKDKGTDIEFIDAVKSVNSMPQAELIKLADEQCDNLILGQSLTSSKGDGGAYALGKVHEGIREEFIRAMGVFVQGVLNTQLIPAILRLNLGKIPERMPTITFSIPGSNVDSGKIDYVDGVVNKLALPVSTQWLYEFLGVPQPSDTDDVFKPTLNRGMSASMDEVSAALAEGDEVKKK